ncbi:MAG: hypothetical protein AcusKO_12590 [Acuticoccus sp.]
MDYGGDPQFTKIEGTEMSYAATNTNSTVILVAGRYFVLQRACGSSATAPPGRVGAGRGSAGGDLHDPALLSRLQRHLCAGV